MLSTWRITWHSFTWKISNYKWKYWTSYRMSYRIRPYGGREWSTQHKWKRNAEFIKSLSKTIKHLEVVFLSKRGLKAFNFSRQRKRKIKVKNPKTFFMYWINFSNLYNTLGLLSVNLHFVLSVLVPSSVKSIENLDMCM